MKRFFKIIGVTLIITTFGLVLFYHLSPYKKYSNSDQRMIKVSEKIEATSMEVYRYLGNSNNVQEWSVFVDHITLLNSDNYQDGSIGSKRRCYKNKDESGEYWDEEILDLKEFKFRLLSCYNLSNFDLSAKNLLTQQIYEPLSDQTTKLSFTLFFESGKASLWDELKMAYASYEIAAVFEENLNNIRERFSN